MATKCFSKFARLRPRSKSPNPLGYGFQSDLITALKSIFKLAWLRPRSGSRLSLSYGLHTCSITASKCISNLAGTRPQKAPQISLGYLLWTCFITASNCVSKLARLWPRSASLCSTRTPPPSASLSYSIFDSKFISKLIRSQPPSATLSSTWSRSPSASPNLLVHGLQMHRWVQLNPSLQLQLPSCSIAASNYISHVHTIMASKCISKFSQSASTGPPAITLQYCLLPEWRYVYI
jgi:hypothetical protein